MSAEGFAERLRSLVDDSSSERAFAREVGIPQGTLRGLLAGKSPTLETLVALASARRISIGWLATGEGPQFSVASEAPPPVAGQGFAEDPAPYSAGPDPELFGRIVDRIAKVHREEGVRLADIDLGRLAAEKYAEIVGLAADPEEWPGFLEVIAARVRKAIRAAAADPANVKREA